MNWCPFCGRNVNQGARVCPHCKRDLGSIFNPGGGTSGADAPFAPPDSRETPQVRTDPAAPFPPPPPPPRPQTLNSAFPAGFAQNHLAPPPAKNETLAMVSLILGILGFCTYVTGAIAIITGLMALSRIKNSDGRLLGRGFAIAGVSCGSISFLLYTAGVIASLAVPQYLHHKFNAAEREAAGNLQEIYEEQAHFEVMNGRYANSFTELDWYPEGSTRYAYFLVTEQFQPDSGGPYELPWDVDTYARDKAFRAVAVANLDDDPDLDVWIVDEEGVPKHIDVDQ